MQKTSNFDKISRFSLPDKNGHFGSFGGVYVPETLMTALYTLREAYEDARKDSLFKDELTLYTDGRLATDDELQFLFGGCPIDGYTDWQMEKYGAKSFGYDFGDNKPNSIISLKNNSVGNLENFFD